jgi:hypothetical protein
LRCDYEDFRDNNETFKLQTHPAMFHGELGSRLLAIIFSFWHLRENFNKQPRHRKGELLFRLETDFYGCDPNVRDAEILLSPITA